MAAPRSFALIRAVTRLYPFMSGCTFPNHRAFVALTGKPAADEWVAVKGGEVLARLDDFVGRSAFFVGDLDRKISAIFDLVVRPGDIALDIGANIGITAVRLASLVGDKGVVHAVEANPALAAQLDHTAARNSLANLRVHAFALGRAPGRLTLFVPTGNMGAASVIPGRVEAPAMRLEVDVKTLDAAFPDLKQLRLIKIDAEGAEPDIIMGGRKTIERLRPVVIFEANAGADRDATLRFFKSVDYRVFGLKKSLFRLAFAEVTSNDDPRYHDLVAFPAETDIALPGGAVLREAAKKAA